MIVTLKTSKELNVCIEDAVHDCLEDGLNGLTTYLEDKVDGEICDNFDEAYNKLKKEFLYTIKDMAEHWLNAMEEEEDDDYDEEPYDLDMGFDPYMGCYTYDC